MDAPVRPSSARHQLFREGALVSDPQSSPTPPSSNGSDLPQVILWDRVVFFAIVHGLALYAIAVVVPRVQTATLWWSLAVFVFGGLGVTVGLHRLWSHQSFKAALPLRVVLMMAACVANQGSIYHWVRDHRVHHKCSETAADPHDASRGIFFSHMGWLLIRKSPAVLIAGNKFNPMNVLCDPVVAFQLVYHRSLVITFFFLSVMAPCLLWGERVLDAIAVAGVLRWILLLHATWSVNSLAHAYGRRPYTRSSCGPAENTLVSLLALGEGWHDWHHAFPDDYACAESDGVWNPSKWCIDACAWVGLATNRKRAVKRWKQRQESMLATPERKECSDDGQTSRVHR